MLSFFRQIIPIVLLRRGPQDLPYSQRLCLFALALSALTSFIYGEILPDGSGGILITFMLTVAFATAVLFLLLSMTGKRARYLQTLTAFFGASVVFGVFNIGIALLLVAGASGSLLSSLYIMLLAWSLLVDGHILSAALDIDKLPACGIALLLFVLQLSFVYLLRVAA